MAISSPESTETRTVTLTVDGHEVTSICGLGQVALGPVISVLRLERDGAVARPEG